MEMIDKKKWRYVSEKLEKVGLRIKQLENYVLELCFGLDLLSPSLQTYPGNSNN